MKTRAMRFCVSIAALAAGTALFGVTNAGKPTDTG